MADDLHIPPEVVAAARVEFGRSLDWTAALRAGLAAWPGMTNYPPRPAAFPFGASPGTIILPLPEVKS